MWRIKTSGNIYTCKYASPEVRRAVVRYDNRDLVELLKSDSDYYVRMEAYKILRGSHWN